MNTRIGTCSICGGDVIGFTGAWGSITPPPPAKCNTCGATDRSDIIRMYKSGESFSTTWDDFCKQNPTWKTKK